MHSGIVALVLLSLAAPCAQAQRDPASLPARDAHDGVLVAADPLTDAAQHKARFGKKNPYDAGILAVEVFFRNDNDRVIRLNLETIQLLLSPPGASRQRLGALAAEDVADRILGKGAPDPSARRRPIPVPGRGSKPSRGKEWDELMAKLRGAAFEIDLLPPRSTVHGVLFFDIDHHYDWLPYARLYVPDLQFTTDKKPLLFFELNLAAAQPR